MLHSNLNMLLHWPVIAQIAVSQITQIVSETYKSSCYIRQLAQDRFQVHRLFTSNKFTIARYKALGFFLKYTIY